MRSSTEANYLNDKRCSVPDVSFCTGHGRRIYRNSQPGYSPCISFQRSNFAFVRVLTCQGPEVSILSQRNVCKALECGTLNSFQPHQFSCRKVYIRVGFAFLLLEYINSMMISYATTVFALLSFLTRSSSAFPGLNFLSLSAIKTMSSSHLKHGYPIPYRTAVLFLESPTTRRL